MKSSKTKEVLEFMENFHTANGRLPTLKQIRSGMKFASHSTAQFHVNKLIADGYIDRVGPLRLTRPVTKDANYLGSSRSRLFVLVRDVDESGVSGTGVVAEGCEFTNGTCTLSWLTAAHSVGVYPNLKELKRIHGHGGKAKIVFI